MILALTYFKIKRIKLISKTVNKLNLSILNIKKLGSNLL